MTRGDAVPGVPGCSTWSRRDRPYSTFESRDRRRRRGPPHRRLPVHVGAVGSRPCPPARSRDPGDRSHRARRPALEFDAVAGGQYIYRASPRCAPTPITWDVIDVDVAFDCYVPSIVALGDESHEFTTYAGGATCWSYTASPDQRQARTGSASNPYDIASAGSQRRGAEQGAEFGAGSDGQLAVGAGQVRLDRLRAHEQRLGNIAVRSTGGG